MDLDRSLLLQLNPYVIACFHNATSLQFEKGLKYLPRTTFAYELEYINYGEGGMDLNEKTIDVREGDIIFKNPGTSVRGIARYSSIIIFFAPFYIPNLEKNYPKDLEIHHKEGKEFKTVETYPGLLLPEIYHPVNTGEFNTLFLNTYHNYLHQNKLYDLHAKTNVLRIIALLSEDAGPTVANKNDPYLKYYAEIIQAEEYIRLNYHLKLYVHDIAGMFNMSVGFFNKLFKKYLKQTPIQYQIKCRLEKAKELLFHTSKTVKEISFECGFNSDTYFETLFMKLEGKSPTQYRKEQTEKYFTRCRS